MWHGRHPLRGRDPFLGVDALTVVPGKFGPARLTVCWGAVSARVFPFTCLPGPRSCLPGPWFVSPQRPGSGTHNLVVYGPDTFSLGPRDVAFVPGGSPKGYFFRGIWPPVLVVFRGIWTWPGGCWSTLFFAMLPSGQGVRSLVWVAGPSFSECMSAPNKQKHIRRNTV